MNITVYFGFDFVAIDGYSNPVDGCAVRICGGDIPLDLSEEIGYRIPDLLRSSRHSADPALTNPVGSGAERCTVAVKV